MSTPRNSIMVPGKTIPLSNEYHLQVARSRVPDDWLQFTGLRRFDNIERELAILGIDEDGVSVTYFALNDLGRQGVYDLLLDDAF